MKNIFIALLVIVTSISCNRDEDKANSKGGWVQLAGTTMGTTYSVIYYHEKGINLKNEIDSVLIDFNNSLSTYIPNSLVSLVNRRDSVFTLEIDPYFYNVFTRSKEIYTITNGAFNPSVMPLVNFWGFGYDKDQTIDTTKIDSLLQLINFDQFSVSTVIVPSKIDDSKDTAFILEKRLPNIQLDFSAIAKGYGADVVGYYLAGNGVTNYFVEIGREIATKGKYQEEQPWRVGVEKPVPGDVTQREIYAIIGLSGEAIATSGNYRNFKEVDGKKISHTINPQNGYPEKSNLLSASIIAKDCMTADAIATACMVLGLEKSLELVNSLENIEGFFIYYDEEGAFKEKFSKGFEKYIIEKPEITAVK